MFDDKAQLHTLEGVIAASLMLMVIAYVIDATSLTPLTSSASNAHMESELKMLGQDILNTMDYSEPGYSSGLRNDVMNWTGKEYIWNGTNYTEKGNASHELKNNLAAVLSRALASRAIAHNVEVTYITISDNVTFPVTRNMITNGNPSNNAIKVSRKLALHDGDIDSTRFPDNPVKDIDPSSSLFNIVDIKLVMWRM